MEPPVGDFSLGAASRLGHARILGRQNVFLVRPQPTDMTDFDLDLRGAEEYLDTDDIDGDVVLGVLDGSTPATEWIAAVENGSVLFLSVEGDLNHLAAGFARDIRDMGGELMHFRQFLIVAPPGVQIDTSRLS